MATKSKKETTDIIVAFYTTTEGTFSKAIGKILNVLDLVQVSKEAKDIIKSELWDVCGEVKRDGFDLISELLKQKVS